jgi:autotransporter-associated beta strand protein
VANGTSYDVISGQGSLTVTGEVVLRGSFDNAGSYAETGTYSGTTTVSGGSLTAYSLANTSGIIVNGNGGSLRVRSYNSTASLTLEASGYANIYGTNLTVGALSNANTAANSLDFEQDWGTITATSLSGVGSTHFASNATITNGIADGTVTVDGLLTSDISGGTITAASLISSSISGSATTVTVSGIATVDTLSSGTVNFNGDTSVSTLNGGTVAIGSGATLTVVNGTSGDAISGQGSLRITGNVALSGANNYTGTTTVSGGMLTTSAGSLAGTSSIAVNSATLNAVDYNQSASLTLDAFGWATISGTDLTVGALTNANGTAPATLNFSGSTGTINAASLAGIGSTRFGSNATIAGGIAEGTVVVVGELNSVISGGIVTTGALSASSMVTGGVVTIMNESNSTANGLIFAGGTVRAGANNVTGTGSLSINAPTRITSDSNASRTFSSAVTLNSNVTLGSSVEGQGGSLTFQGDVNLGGVGIVVTTDSAVTISGAISNGSIVKSGDATLTLTGANTYTGVTIVSAGTLEAAAGSLATTSAIVVNGGTLNAVDYNSTASLAVGSAGTANISGADLTLGSLSNSNTTPGGLNFTSSTGTITIGDLSGVGSTHFSSNAIILGGIKEGVVDVAGNLEANISGGIVTTYTLTSSCIITGGDVTILKESTDNTALTFAGGIIRAGENNVTAQADLTINALTTITSDSNATRIFNSAIALNSDIALGSAVDGQGGTLIFQGNLDLGGNARTVTTDSAVIMSGTISDGSLVKTGSSTLTLSGNNNYTGATTVSAGTLITSGDNIISSTSGVTIDNGAILQLGGSETINAINNNGTIELGKGASLSTGNDNASTTLGGALAGTGTIVKNGTGELIVANTNNNFGGTVTIAGGILSAVGTNALGNSTINVESGATFAANATLDNNVIVKDGGLLKGSGSMGAVTLNSGGTLAPGNSPGLQTHSSLTINGGASILWQVCDFNSLVRGVDYDSIAVTGKLDLSNASSTNKITVNVMSLANIADSTPGNALNFDYVLPYQFVFATYDTLELGTNTNFGSLFRIDVSAFLDAGGKPMLSDYWRMSYRDHAIYLSYASVLGPGNIPDQMTVGDFTLTGTGTLEVAGLPYNGGHYNDVVKFSGLATLDSSTTLTIARYGAVSPLYGYRYVLFEGTGTPANPNLVSSYFTGTPAPTTVNTSDLNGRYLIAAPAAVNGTISAYDGLIHNADGLVHAPNEYAVYFVRDAAGYNLPGIDSSLVSFVQKITMAGPGGPLESGGTVYIPGETTPALSPLGARLMIMTDPQLQFAMNNLTPNFYGVIPSIIATGQRSDFQTLSGELGQYHHERDEANSSFSQGFVRVKSSTSKGGTGSDSVPFDTSASGVMAGYVKGMSASSVAGFTISNDDSKGTQQSNSLKGNTFSGTAFVSSATNSSVGTMYFDAGVSAGYSSSKSTRTSFIGPETATPKAQSYGAFARVGLKQDNASGFGFSPYLGMDYVRVNGDAFSESGDDASMSVAAYHYDSSRLTVGANVSWVDADTTSPFKFDLAFEAFSEIGGGKSVDLTSGFGSAGSFTSRAAVSSGGGYRIAPSFVYQDSAESSYYLNFSVERSGASSIKGAELGYRRRF